MSVIINVTVNFKNEAKPLLKKYASLKTDLQKLKEELLLNPKLGTPLGNDVYKIRLKISSKGKEKSGGARVISYIETEVIAQASNEYPEMTINLISIYDKSDTATISDKELKKLIAGLKP